MTKPKTEVTYDELLRRLPPETRPAVARARNNRIRLQQARNAAADASAASKRDVIDLHHTHKLSMHMIARLLDLSRQWIREVLAEAE